MKKIEIINGSTSESDGIHPPFYYSLRIEMCSQPFLLPFCILCALEMDIRAYIAERSVSPSF